MLKKYSELTPEQQKLVTVMYSDKSTLEQYLYNFEDNSYRGRQYNPEGMSIHNEPVQSSVDEDTAYDDYPVKEDKPKKVSRRTRKK